MSNQDPQHIYHYAIDAFGNWTCEGNPVTEQELVRILSRSIFMEGGNYFIRCEGEVHPVQVADAPLWVHCVHVKTNSKGDLQHVEIELEDGRRELLDGETLTVVQNQALYCLATPRRLKARFGKLAYYELTQYLQMDENGEEFYFVIAGRRYNIEKESEKGAPA
ncbi:DUF1285 domain-containing protein [Desulforhabdus amnigena]|jgi:hypothetical protein|uniref:DUF1285 domain-containing protein n=1 Tax=Desulforhabdus amnigena TaxID=40218 RepID=A0A9W6FRT6_9BACT|nr:DUF1285 domain-containing protein [Desulforhabdus amnigena]NLJ28601.1 DUF1285 domain-containing protein [Deltaproteobacteria bacterium]GLI33872.1 hypothetical protein DAMNIGENAA_13050 [Desulforhabdus amnigena]